MPDGHLGRTTQANLPATIDAADIDEYALKKVLCGSATPFRESDSEDWIKFACGASDSVFLVVSNGPSGSRGATLTCMDIIRGLQSDGTCFGAWSIPNVQMRWEYTRNPFEILPLS